MLNIHLLIRNLLRNKTYLLLNLAGLAIAFAISYFILAYVTREASFNRSFSDFDRIARVLTVKKTFGWTEPSSSYPLHLKLKSDVPGIEAATPVRRFRSFIVERGQESLRVRMAYAATADFFIIFTPDVILGDQDRFFENPYSVVLTRSLADRIFGNIPVQGAPFDVVLGANRITMTVGGVIEDFPETTSVRPELIGSFDLMKYEFPEGSYFGDYLDAWQKDMFSEFVLTDPNSDINDVIGAIDMFSDELPEGYDYSFTLQPVSRIHLFSADYVNDGKRGDIKFVILYGAVGLLILVIAISNYIIMSIGSSSRRIPEIAIRKIFGAKSGAIRRYLLFESVIICLLSIPLSYVITYFTFSRVEELFNIDLSLDGNHRLTLYLLAGFLVLFTGVLSGGYLAGKLGRTSPLQAMGVKRSGAGGKYLYKILITMQIVIFVSLLSSAFIVLKQISYSKNVDPGFSSENLIIGEFPSGLITDFTAFRYELGKNPNLENISFGSLLPPTQSAMVSVIRPSDGGEEIKFEGVSADFNFINTTGIEVIAGRAFDQNIASDSSATLINETLAEKLGVDGYSYQTYNNIRNIIGIVRDFQVHSVREAIPPLTIQVSKAQYVSSFIAKCNPGTTESVTAYIKERFNEYEPDFLTITTYDEAVSNLYGKEAQFGLIVSVFGVIALIVAMLGVFGLSLFLTNEQRFDTAVYRVFGASPRIIVQKNMGRYLLYILLGNIISVPLVIILMSRWLQQFAERAPIGPWIFAGAFTISAILFIATTLINTLRLANLNPVDNLRQE